MKENKALEDLITGCSKNDRLSQEKLYRLYYPMLFCLCRKFFKDDDEALQALNDGMLKVFKNINTYHAEKGSFFNWTYTIVRNVSLDKIKSKSRTLHVELGSEDHYTEEDNPLKILENKDFSKWLDCLPPATRVVCGLFYMEGYTIKNVAEVLDLSVGTVKWHLSESRRKLQPLLEKYYLKNQS